MNLTSRICYIVLMHNGASDTIEALEGILNQKGCCNIDILVIDNKSDRTEAETVKVYAYAHKIKYIYREVNDGYTGGNNFGWKQVRSKYDYVFIINSDIIFNSQTLTRYIVKIFEEDEKLSIVGPVVRFGDDRIIFPNRLLRMAFKNGIHGKFRRTKRYTECDSVIGCFLAIRTKNIMFENLFNENFFMYADELELCLRAWDSGYSVAHVNNRKQSIYHKGGNNPFFNLKTSLWKYYLAERNLVLCAKNIHGFLRIRYLLLLFFSCIYRVVFGKSTWKQKKAIVHGFINGLKLFRLSPDNNEILKDALMSLQM